jgi:hypothetical protein
MVRNPLWLDDSIQFPRLLDEIRATQELDYAALCDSMDLTSEEIDELFDRAMAKWEVQKASL